MEEPLIPRVPLTERRTTLLAHVRSYGKALSRVARDRGLLRMSGQSDRRFSKVDRVSVFTHRETSPISGGVVVS